MAKTLKLVIQTDAKTGAIKVVGDELETLSRHAKKASASLDSISGTVDNTSAAMDKLKAITLGLAGSVGSVIALKQAFDGLMNAVSVAAEFEKFSTVLETVEGSSKKAADSMKWVEEFAQKTPYELDKVTEAFVRLKSYGLEAKDGLLRALGDTAAAMGKPIMQAVEAIADATTNEFERLKEFGITTQQNAEKVAFRWVDSFGKAKAIIVKKNKEVIQSTLEAIFNSKYAGAMDRLSQTWEGVVSNLNDTWTKFKKDLVVKSGVFDSLKLGLIAVQKYFDKLMSNEDRVKALGKALVVAMKGGVKMTALMAKGIMKIPEAFERLSYSFSRVVNFIDKLWTKMLIRWHEGLKTFFEKTPFGLGEQRAAMEAKRIEELTKKLNGLNLETLQLDVGIQETIKGYDEFDKTVDGVADAMLKAMENTKGTTKENDKLKRKTVEVKGAFNDLGGTLLKTSKKSQVSAKKMKEAYAKAYEEMLNRYKEYYQKTGQIENANQIKRYQAAVKYQEQLKGIEGDELNRQLDLLAGITKANEDSANKVVDIWKDAADDISNAMEAGLAKFFHSGKIEAGMKQFAENLASSFETALIKSLVSGNFTWSGALKNFQGGIQQGGAQIDKTLDSVGLGGANDYLKSIGAKSTLGETALYFQAGKYGGNFVANNLLAGSQTQAGNYGGTGAALGSMIYGPVGAVIGGSLGAVIGGFNAKWQTKETGIHFGGFDDIATYKKQKKDKIFGFADKHRTIYDDPSAEIVQYFQNIRMAVAKINDAIDGTRKLVMKENVKADKISEEVARGLIGLTGKRGHKGIFGQGFGDAGIKIDQGIALVKFKEYAKKIGKKIDEAVIEAFSKELTITESLKENLKKTFGDKGKKLGEEVELILKNEVLKTPEDFSNKISEMVLKQITGYQKAIDEAFKNTDFSNPIKGAISFQKSFSQINAKYESVKSAWKDWAEKTGKLVIEGINEGLEALHAQDVEWDNFISEYFGNKINVLTKQVRESMGDFYDALSKVDTGGVQLTIANFKKLKEEFTTGFNFKPENIKAWGDLQTKLENAAMGAKQLAGALEGLIAQYGDVINKFNEKIAEFQGWKVETEQVTMQAMENLANIILNEKDNYQKQLSDSQNFLSKMDEYNKSFDARLQQFIETSKDTDGKLAKEVADALAVGLEGLNKEITTLKAQIEKGKASGKDISALVDKLGVLEQQQETLKEIADKFKTEGLTQDIAEAMKSANDVIIGTMGEKVKEGLQESQNTLEELLQEANGYLAQIEGTLQENQNNDKLVEWVGKVSEGIDTIPDKIAEPLNTSMDGLKEAIVDTDNKIAETIEGLKTGLAESMDASIQVLNETITGSMNTMSETLQAIPQTFSEAIAPVVDGINAMIEGLQNTAAQIKDGVIEAMAPVQEAVSNLGGSIQELVGAENATTGAVVSAGNQIAGSLGGLMGAIDSMRAESAAAAQAAAAAAQNSAAAIEAAAAARNQAAAATAQNAQLTNSIDKLAAVTNIQTQTAGAA